MVQQRPTRIKDIPDSVPVFPLSNVLLLPNGNLPLNIFEDRYLAMIDDALRSNRVIGMIQTRDDAVITPKDVTNQTPLYDVGCLGRITSFTETDDGRYLISLTGLCRFKCQKELDTLRGYRQFHIDCTPFERDLQCQNAFFKDREDFIAQLKKYFFSHGMECNWQQVAQTPDDKLITLLSMICPFSSHEKQALLEAENPCKRADMLLTLLNIESRLDSSCEKDHSHH